MGKRGVGDQKNKVGGALKVDVDQNAVNFLNSIVRKVIWFVNLISSRFLLKLLVVGLFSQCTFKQPPLPPLPLLSLGGEDLRRDSFLSLFGLFLFLVRLTKFVGGRLTLLSCCTGKV